MSLPLDAKMEITLDNLQEVHDSIKSVLTNKTYNVLIESNSEVPEILKDLNMYEINIWKAKKKDLAIIDPVDTGEITFLDKNRKWNIRVTDIIVFRENGFSVEHNTYNRQVMRRTFQIQ
jgi:hypothetical protein